MAEIHGVSQKISGGCEASGVPGSDTVTAANEASAADCSTDRAPGNMVAVSGGRHEDASSDASAVEATRRDAFLGPSRRTVKKGDAVIIYESFSSVKPLIVTPGNVYNNRHGEFHHEDMVGVRYGEKIYARKSQGRGKAGYVYLLQPSSNLWSASVKMRTQIIQPSDQSTIIGELWIKPGSVVVESGTGSGILSTALATAVHPNGQVNTFEFNEHRATCAASEFEQNGLDSIIKIEHRDICTQGFPENLNGKVDAVMLDVPSPWLAVVHARKVMKAGARLCTYSPCIEQVQRNCRAMEKEGFHSISTIECRLRTLDVRETDFAEPLFVTVEEYTKNFLDRKRRLLLQKAASDKRNPDNSSVGNPEVAGKKRQRKAGGDSERPHSRAKIEKNPRVTTRVATAKPYHLARGHTAFLTFATAKC